MRRDARRIIGERMVPSGTRLDMNRAFPGSPDGTPLEYMCYQVIQAGHLEGLADGRILTRDRFHSGQLLYHLARVGAQHRYVIGWEMQPLFVFPRKGGHRQLGYVKLAQERPMLCEIFLPADDVKIVEKII